MIEGIFASNQGIVGDRVGDFSSSMLMINPTGNTPLLGLTSGMEVKPATDTTFTWFEDSHQSGRTLATGGGTTNTVVVEDGTLYVAGNILEVEDTGEHIYVSGVAGNDLTVMRGFASTDVVAITNGMGIQLLSNAHPEASGVPTAQTQQGAARLNYVQLFRNSWAISGTAKVISFRTGNKKAKSKMDCALYHGEAMERAFLWGRKHVGIMDGNPFHTTDGIIAQIENSNGLIEVVENNGNPGDYSRGQLEDWMRRLFERNVKGQPNERLVFTSNRWVAALGQMAHLDGSYEIGSGETVLGMKITKIITPFGDLTMVTHPLMNESALWNDELYAIHPGAIRKRTLRPTFPEDYDTNGNRIGGQDADQGILTTECGIEVGAASVMGVLRGFNRAVATTPTA